MIETAETLDAHGQAWRPDASQRIGEVSRDVTVDLADEAQGEVQLGILLPPEIGAIIHRVEQHIADWRGRAERDEQAVHEVGLGLRAQLLQPLRGDRGEIRRQVVERPFDDVLDLP